jgi:RNA polymerase sigma factor (sigma-70 family)
VNASDEHFYTIMAIEGDKQAFNLLADHYYAACFQKALAIVRDETLAQDLTQISLLQAYHCMDKLKDPSRFKYWLFGIVRNISHNYLKQKKKQLTSFEQLQHFFHENQQEEANPQINELILSAVHSLEKKYRNLMLAFYYDGLSLQEIAQQQQLSLSATKVRLHRARLMLKQTLGGHEDLFYYYQKPVKKKTMQKLTIADIYEKENRCATLLLQTEAGDYFLPVIVGYPEAEAIVFGLQSFKKNRPWTHDLAASILTATEIKVTEICIHKLINGVFYAYLAIQKGSKKVEVDTRPSDAIALAVRLQAPIFVAEDVLEEAGVPIPAAYQNAKPKGKGMNRFVRYFAEEKAYQIAYETWRQREEKVTEKQKPRELNEQLLRLVFGDGDLPKANLTWQPHRYTTWDEAYKEPDSVQWLDLQNQNLNDFTEKIKPFLKIKALELTEYGITELPSGIEQLKNLQRLNLRHNHLVQLPSDLVQLTQLRNLNLSKNAWQELPEVAGQLPALQKLNLSENPALYFSQALQVLGKSKTLDHLILNKNNINLLPKEISHLSYLVALELGKNPALDFSHLFQVLQKVPSLLRLELQHNELVSFPDEILLLQQLVWLNFNDNPALDLKSLCQRLSQLKNLKVLLLMRCNLSSFPEELQLLKNLEVLELGENSFSANEQERIKKLLPDTTIVF